MPSSNTKPDNIAYPKRSTPLSFGQLTALGDGAIVWIRYHKSSESTARINQAARLEKSGDGVWIFRDPKTDSSICDMVRDYCSADSDPAIQHCRGEFQVFSVVPDLNVGRIKGHASLEVGTNKKVTTMDDQEPFDVHMVGGTILVLYDERAAIAETIAVAAIERAVSH